MLSRKKFANAMLHFSYRMPLVRDPLKTHCMSHFPDKLMVAALQVNSDALGYGISFKADPCNVHIQATKNCQKWELHVLTKPDGTFDSFGVEAMNEYKFLDPEKEKIGGPDGYNLFSNFTMIRDKKVIPCFLVIFFGV